MKTLQKYTRIIFYATKLAATILIAFLVYKFLFDEILTKKIHFVFYFLFWIFSSYIVLPWITRKLTSMYVPNYYIGRTKTSDGLLGDPINLAFYSNQDDITSLFINSGWSQADKLGLKSSLMIVFSSIRKTSYATAPVSTLFLFNEPQTLAFERQVNNNPRKRHHVRLWQTPDGWRLPGGKEADWLGAATYDRNIGFSLFTGQITHKIDKNTDTERDNVIATIKDNPQIKNIEVVKNFTTSYHSRNGGGDQIETDGSLPFIHVKKPL